MCVCVCVCVCVCACEESKTMKIDGADMCIYVHSVSHVIWKKHDPSKQHMYIGAIYILYV